MFKLESKDFHMRKYILYGAITGLAICLLFLFIPIAVDLNQHEKLNSIYMVSIEFLWPGSLMLMVFQNDKLSLQGVITLLFIISINMGFYSFLGYLIWLGLSKNKCYFVFPPLILLFLYYFFWDLID